MGRAGMLNELTIKEVDKALLRLTNVLLFQRFMGSPLDFQMVLCEKQKMKLSQVRKKYRELDIRLFNLCSNGRHLKKGGRFTL